MTYFQFHVAYTLPALAAMMMLQARPLGGIGAKSAWTWLAVVATLAIVYTTPWDNYLIYRDVWGYTSSAVIGTIGYVPIEEYAFFVIQTMIAGLFYFVLRGHRLLTVDHMPMPRLFRPVGIAVGAALAAVGAACLIHPSEHALYMGLILVWAPPVLAGMWAVGAAKVWADRRRVAVSIGLPTLYLWIVDRIAIRRGIWDIRDRYSLTFDPFGLPVEEATFFLLTTALCVVGLVLFLPPPPTER